MADELVRQAVAQAKSGNKTDARKLATRAIKSDPNNVAAWVVMAQVVEDRKKAMDCLETVLKLEPGHPWATLHLNRLRNPGQAAPAPAPSRAPAMSSIESQLAEAEDDDGDMMADLRKRQSSSFDMRIEDLGDFVGPVDTQDDFGMGSAELDPFAGTEDWKRQPTSTSREFSYNEIEGELDRMRPEQKPARRAMPRALFIVLFIAVFILFAVIAIGIGAYSLGFFN